MPETLTSRKGKQRRVYRWYAEILRQLPDLGCACRERHGSGAEDAESQTEAVRRNSSAEDGVRPTAVEMTAHGHGGKPKAGFPPRPQALEIAQDAIRVPSTHTGHLQLR